jgi:hypothetical protein
LCFQHTASHQNTLHAHDELTACSCLIRNEADNIKAALNTKQDPSEQVAACFTRLHQALLQIQDISLAMVLEKGRNDPWELTLHSNMLNFPSFSEQEMMCAVCILNCIHGVLYLQERIKPDGQTMKQCKEILDKVVAGYHMCNTGFAGKIFLALVLRLFSLVYGDGQQLSIPMQETIAVMVYFLLQQSNVTVQVSKDKLSLLDAFLEPFLSSATPPRPHTLFILSRIAWISQNPTLFLESVGGTMDADFSNVRVLQKLYFYHERFKYAQKEEASCVSLKTLFPPDKSLALSVHDILSWEIECCMEPALDPLDSTTKHGA